MSDSPATAALSEHPLRTVWGLAWPAVALNGLQTVNSLLDSYFIQHLESDALTAIGSATTTIFLLISLTMAIGVASTAMVARAYGEGDIEKCREANRKCLGFAIIATIALTLLAIPLIPFAADLLVPKETPHARELMISYLHIVTFVLAPSFIIQTLAGSLRGIGDTKSPMVISGLQILLHIALNYLLIFPDHHIGPFVIPGANLGLNGAGLALTISAWISAAIYLFGSSRTPLGEVWRIKFPGLDWIKRIFNLAAPAGLMALVRVTSLMAFFTILTRVPGGEYAIGGLRPGFSIESLAFMPSFGLAIAASALVGQSLGMKDPGRAKRLGWIAAHQAGIVSLVGAVIIFVFAKPISASVLSDQPLHAAQTASYLRYICYTEVFFGYAVVLISAMQGAGDTRRPFWITLACMWFIRFPLAAILALPTVSAGPISIPGFAMGANGCWLSIAITQAVQGIICLLIWHQGRWAEAKV